ncbi:putative signal-transduction protein with CBS domains [Pelodictyon phaeoclathratiforme BU-1]|uniref:Putative signal-transduction protein with CBS domains n=2 Tax=Pelodictyon phaeoclathratiforme TaxID=34090 RepID=B4SGE0_PELPB|nr:putative signal-transduction protein with CBS domains [Pelodictyon phaeoclathratiforme BU-1]
MTMDQLITLRTLAVSALMQKDFQIIKGSCTVAEALQIMKRSRESGLIVEPRNEDDCYGIVTEKDILEKVIDPGEDVYRDPWNTPVFQIMSKPVISVNPGLRVKYALRLMKRSNVRRLTVMENNKIIGILNMTDVLHAVEELPVHDDHVAL